MKLEKRKPSGREKDEASIRLLEHLRQKLYSDNSSVARRAAFQLSWMQEDGLEILQEALLRNDVPRRTKSAAAYGLRSMRGRMKKLSRAVLEEGAKDSNEETRDVCLHALELFGKPKSERHPASQKKNRSKYQIKEIKPNRKRSEEIRKNNNNRSRPSGRDFARRK